MEHKVVSHEEWLAARQELLAKEKAFTRQCDEMSRLQRDLPWERVTKEYVFDGPDGRQTLADLFAGRSQLIIYHFMFHPDDKAGCPHCSLRADGFAGVGATSTATTVCPLLGRRWRRNAPSITPTRATDRGNDKLNVHYHYLDLVPKGRDEGGRGPYWVRRRDEYDR